MIEQPFSGRLEAFRKQLTAGGFDAYLVVVPENRYYLSGYGEEDLQLTESSGALLITGSRQFLLTDFRYQEAAKQQAPGFELVIYGQGLAQVLPELFADLAVRQLGVEAHHLTQRSYSEIEGALKKADPKAVMRDGDGLIEGMRVIKEPGEIERIKASLALTERVVAEVWAEMAAGMTEKALAWEIERRIREGGGEAVSFPPIVASGPNAALPHAVPTDRPIGAGESVILDLGSKLNHYCSDMTRTWFSARPEKRLQEIYHIVHEAQQAAQEAVRAGKDSTEIDGVARFYIHQAGYGDYFGHGLGHGVGLAVHERPGLRKHTGVTLEENMVVTIEPGIYIPGFGGVRLENMVRITGAGCEVLSQETLFYDWR